MYTVNVDGSGLRPLTAGLTVALSPDGTKLAVVRAYRGTMKVFVETRAGKGWHSRLLFPNDRRHELGVSWAPDGRRLAVMRAREEVPHGARAIDLARSPSDIWVVAADGSGARKLPGGSRPNLHSFGPSWSPDGTLIAFTGVPVEVMRQFRGVHVGDNVFVMRADGTRLTPITNAAKNESNLVWHQPWSPDSQRLVFMQRRRGLAVMGADGGARKQLRGDPDAIFPIWSPDGTQIAFTRHGRDGVPHIYTMPVRGGKAIHVTIGVAIQWPAR